MKSDGANDIYSSPQKKHEDWESYRDPSDGNLSAERLLREYRISRIKSFTYTFLVFCILAVLAGAVLYRSLQSDVEDNQIRRDKDPVPLEPTTEAGELVSDTDVLIDAFTESKPEEIPLKGDLPLTVVWVQETARQLYLAEKANRENDKEAALEHYKTAQHIFPEIRGLARRIGLIQIRDKKYQEAATAFQQAIKEEPMSYSLYNNLGVALLRSNAPEMARKAFEQALRIKPEYAAAELNLSILYAEQNQDEQSAVHLKKYCELEPDNIDAAQKYAALLIRLERWEEAVTQLSDLSMRTPDVPPVYFRLSEALAHLERREEALNVLQRACELVSPKNALARMSDPRFDLLREHPRFIALTKLLASNQR